MRMYHTDMSELDRRVLRAIENARRLKVYERRTAGLRLRPRPGRPHHKRPHPEHHVRVKCIDPKFAREGRKWLDSFWPGWQAAWNCQHNVVVSSGFPLFGGQS